MHTLPIRSERLSLVPASASHVRSELESPASLGTLLGASLPASWPPGEYDRDAQQFFLAKLEESEAHDAGWYAWYALLRPRGLESAVVVGTGGYFGPPSAEGVVEIGYSICPEYRGMGFATEIARVLTEHAMKDERVHRVVARTNADNPGSITVLQRAGFVQCGDAIGSAPGQLRFERLRAGVG